MNYLIWILPITLLIAANFLLIEIKFSEKELKIKIFGIPVLIKKGEKMEKMVRNLIDNAMKEDTKKHEQEMEIIKHIKIRDTYLEMITEVDDYATFSQICAVWHNYFGFIYFLFRSYIPDLRIVYSAGKENRFLLASTLRINLFVILFYIWKGKTNYASTRNQ